MRFSFTLNMPSRSGNQIHQVVGDHPARSLADLMTTLRDEGFVIIEEFYKDGTPQGSHSEGPVLLNADVVGKVKVFAGG